MPNYLIKSQPDSSLILNASTSMQNEVGICYFDPISETLKEISELSNHLLTIQPYKKVIRKYYLATDFGGQIENVEISPEYPELPEGYPNIDQSEFYSIKLIISQSEPTLSQFDDRDDMEPYQIAVTAGQIIPIWILIQSFKPLNMSIPLLLSVNYD